MQPFGALPAHSQHATLFRARGKEQQEAGRTCGQVSASLPFVCVWCVCGVCVCMCVCVYVCVCVWCVVCVCVHVHVHVYWWGKGRMGVVVFLVPMGD